MFQFCNRGLHKILAKVCGFLFATRFQDEKTAKAFYKHFEGAAFAIAFVISYDSRNFFLFVQRCGRFDFVEVSRVDGVTRLSSGFRKFKTGKNGYSERIRHLTPLSTHLPLILKKKRWKKGP